MYRKLGKKFLLKVHELNGEKCCQLILKQTGLVEECSF